MPIKMLSNVDLMATDKSGEALVFIRLIPDNFGRYTYTILGEDYLTNKLDLVLSKYIFPYVETTTELTYLFNVCCEYGCTTCLEKLIKKLPHFDIKARYIGHNNIASVKEILRAAL